jgi:hypothetical protein
MDFKHYKRTGLSEMISVTEFIANGGDMTKVSIADVDAKLLTTDFQQGFIARNPKNHEDLWYVSKKYFDDNLEEVATATSNLTFGQAIEAVKQGKRISRQGWNGKGMFVFMQVPSEIAKDIVPKMQSLPQSVKDEFQRRFENSSGSIYYSNQLALVNPSNLINGWAPSVSDALAEDWVVLD